MENMLLLVHQDMMLTYMEKHMYFILIMVRGAIADVYPYPFLDASRLGIRRLLINAGLLTFGFVLGGLTTVGLDRLLGRTRLR